MLSRVQLFATPLTVDHQAPLSMGFFPGKFTGVACHFLPQGIFPTQGSNLGLLHYRQILYRLSYQNQLQKHLLFFFVMCKQYYIMTEKLETANKQKKKRNRKEILYGSLKDNHACYILLIYAYTEIYNQKSMILCILFYSLFPHFNSILL